MNLFNRSKLQVLNEKDLTLGLNKMEGQMTDQELFTLYKFSLELSHKSIIVELGRIKENQQLH